MNSDPKTSALWNGVDRLIERAPSLQDLRAHRLHVLAARHWRETGRDVPFGLVMEELRGIQLSAAAADVLRTLREAYDGEILILKGPEVAAYYPSPELRPSYDLDVLVDDAEGAQRAALSDGFEAIGPKQDAYFDGLHHLRPIRLTGGDGPIVEIHRRVNWMTWADPPPTSELVAAAVPSRVGIPGVLTLPAAHHAVTLAAHSWEEMPLRRLSDLVDIAALSADAAATDMREIARDWGLERMWNTTWAALDTLIFSAPPPWSLRIWGRNLLAVRDRTVLEAHWTRWASPYGAFPPARAALATGRAVIDDLTPAGSESWANKGLRVREALRNPRRPNAEHEEAIGPEGIQPRFRRR